MLSHSLGIFKHDSQSEKPEIAIAEFLGEVFNSRIPPWYEGVFNVIENFMQDPALYSDCVADSFYSVHPSVSQESVNKLTGLRCTVWQATKKIIELERLKDKISNLELSISQFDSLIKQGSSLQPLTLASLKASQSNLKAELDELERVNPQLKTFGSLLAVIEKDIKELDKEFIDKVTAHVNGQTLEAKGRVDEILSSKDLRFFELVYHYKKRQCNRTVIGAIANDALAALKQDLKLDKKIYEGKLEITKQLLDVYSHMHYMAGMRRDLFSPFSQTFSDSLFDSVREKFSKEIELAEKAYFEGKSANHYLPNELGVFIDDSSKKQQLEAYLMFFTLTREYLDNLVKLLKKFEFGSEKVKQMLKALDGIKEEFEKEEKYLSQFFPVNENENASYLSQIPGANVVASTAHLVTDGVTATAQVITGGVTATASVVTTGIFATTSAVTSTASTLTGGVKNMLGFGRKSE